MFITVGSSALFPSACLGSPLFFEDCPGEGANLGSFGFRLFSHSSSALDHSAAAHPFSIYFSDALPLLRLVFSLAEVSPISDPS